MFTTLLLLVFLYTVNVCKSGGGKMTTSAKTAITNQVSSSDVTTLKHCIDPTVDFVFKLLFGSPENLKLVIHFLNCLLKTDDKQWSKIIDVYRKPL